MIVTASPVSHGADIRVDTPPPRSTPPVDAAFEERWAAWVARGRQRDLAIRRKFRFAIIAVAIVGGVFAMLFRLFGGAV